MALKNRPSGLGRGLNAIFDLDHNPSQDNIQATKSESVDVASAPTVNGVEHVALSDIVPNPNQPRKYFDNELIDELSQSIRSLGIIQPLTVKDTQDGRYSIISGERRYKAAIRAGLTHVPVYIRRVNDQKLVEMALVENIQREDLNPMEIAMSLDRLLSECNMTQDELSQQIGKSRTAISNYVRLLKLATEVQIELRNGNISMGHAKVLLALTDIKMQIEATYEVVRKGLSVRDTELLIAKIQNIGKKECSNEEVVENEIPKYYTHFEDKFQTIFGRKISINRNNKGESKIVISFKNDEEVETLLNKLSN